MSETFGHVPAEQLPPPPAFPPPPPPPPPAFPPPAQPYGAAHAGAGAADTASLRDLVRQPETYVRGLVAAAIAFVVLLVWTVVEQTLLQTSKGYPGKAHGAGEFVGDVLRSAAQGTGASLRQAACAKCAQSAQASGPSLSFVVAIVVAALVMAFLGRRRSLAAGLVGAVVAAVAFTVLVLLCLVPGNDLVGGANGYLVLSPWPVSTAALALVWMLVVAASAVLVLSGGAWQRAVGAGVLGVLATVVLVGVVTAVGAFRAEHHAVPQAPKAFVAVDEEMVAPYQGLRATSLALAVPTTIEESGREARPVHTSGERLHAVAGQYGAGYLYVSAAFAYAGLLGSAGWLLLLLRRLGRGALVPAATWAATSVVAVLAASRLMRMREAYPQVLTVRLGVSLPWLLLMSLVAYAVLGGLVHLVVARVRTTTPPPA